MNGFSSRLLLEFEGKEADVSNEEKYSKIEHDGV
jgi:hypothetical protein